MDCHQSVVNHPQQTQRPALKQMRGFRVQTITKTNTNIMTYGVFYVATREAKTFAGMQDELIATFNNFNDAVDMANSETYLDEMHDGYVVRNL